MIPLFLVALVVTARVYLPFYVKNYVNNVLSDLPGYYGQIEGVDISLWRGAYAINGLYLNRIDADSEIPFLDLKKTDISIQWKSLLKGKIVSEIEMTQPSLTYVFEDQNKSDAPDPNSEDWTKALTDLVPIDINRLYINQGKIAFVQLAANPNIDLKLDSIELEAKNLKNVVTKGQELPSEILATAVSIGNGTVNLKGKMNILKEIPDIDISFALENAAATSLNDLTKYYAGLDFNKGSYGIFSEIAIANGYLKGYLKPILKDAKLLGKEDSFLNGVWEGFVGFFKFAMKNHKNNTLATNVPLEGNLNNVKTKIWPTVINIFKNAWIQSYKEVTDDKINFEDALESKN